jgi:hypothetical protein
MNYESCLEKLTEYFSSSKYQKEVVKAKEQFFGDIGVSETDTSDFERHLTLFFDWYLLTRALQGTLLTPAKMSLNLEGFEITTESRPFYEALAGARFSLFEYSKSKGQDHYARNLFTGEKIVVKKSLVNFLLPKGSIFSTHYVADKQNNFFTNGLICHPLETRKFIMEQAKKAQKQSYEEQVALIYSLTRMYFKLDRYPHVTHQQIYSLNSAVRF